MLGFTLGYNSGIVSVFLKGYQKEFWYCSVYLKDTKRVELKVLITRENSCNCVVMDLTRLAVVIISQYMQIEHHCCIPETNVIRQLYLNKKYIRAL